MKHKPYDITKTYLHEAADVNVDELEKKVRNIIVSLDSNYNMAQLAQQLEEKLTLRELSYSAVQFVQDRIDLIIQKNRNSFETNIEDLISSVNDKLH